MMYKEVFLLSAISTAYCFHSFIENESKASVKTQALFDRLKVLENIVLSHPAELTALKREVMGQIDAQQKTHLNEIASLRKEFESRMSAMQYEYDSKLSDMKDSYEKTVTVLKNSVHELQNACKQEKIVHKFEEDVQKGKIEELKNINDQRQENESTDSIFLPKENAIQDGLQRSTRQARGMVVAFFATLSQTTTHLGTNQDIIFDRVVTNIGNAYDANHGIFRAPVDGMYVFSASLTMKERDDSHFGFVRNTERLTKMGLHGSENYGDNGSNTIAVHLARGDDVSVQHYDSDKGIWGDNHCMMMGFLLAEDDTEPVVVGK